MSLDRANWPSRVLKDLVEKVLFECRLRIRRPSLVFAAFFLLFPSHPAHYSANSRFAFCLGFDIRPSRFSFTHRPTALPAADPRNTIQLIEILFVGVAVVVSLTGLCRSSENGTKVRVHIFQIVVVGPRVGTLMC